MNLSIIIIGQNVDKTLESSILHVYKAISNTSHIADFEIIYVDSNSSDHSLNIAKKLKVDCIEIIEGFTSASLGRYLGIKYAQYDNFLFLDGDMDIDKDWFNASYLYYKKYGAVTGERYEKLYKNNELIDEIQDFYNIKNVEVGNNIGGAFMLERMLVKSKNFTPLLMEEEERDFYAKFFDTQKIYKIPVQMFIHNNYNLSLSRLKSYFMPFNKFGYILSFMSSIKNGYYKSFLKLQGHYVMSTLASILFYVGLFSLNGLLMSLSLIVIFLAGIKNLKGTIMTMLFFPYKLIMSQVFLRKNLYYKYRFSGNEYRENINI